MLSQPVSGISEASCEISMKYSEIFSEMRL